MCNGETQSAGRPDSAASRQNLLEIVSEALRWIWVEIAAIARLEFLPGLWREAFLFGLRLWAACMLALYLAFLFQIDEAYWAGLTVCITMQPGAGATISKGFYRIIGSIVGAAMGVVLIALFAQAPELFILALAVWMGLTTLVSNLLTNFRGYASVLAGYTAAIVALGAYGIQDQVFNIALARGAATIIAIISTTAVTVIFAPHRAEALVFDEIHQSISDMARRVAMPLGRTLSERLALGRPLVARLIKLDTDIEFAEAESPTVRIHAGLARSVVAHLFAVLTAKRALEEHLGRVGFIQDAKTLALYNEALKLFEKIPVAIAGKERGIAERVRVYHHLLWEPMQGEAAGSEAQQISSRLVRDQLGTMALHFERAVTNWLNIQGGWKRDPVLQLNFHRDRRQASINALRTFLSVIVGGAFWIESEWSSGAFFLIQFSIGCALFCVPIHPETLAAKFGQGVILGVVAAYICTFHFLVNLEGFVPFALAQALFLIPGAMIQLIPRFTAIGVAYCVFFIAVEQPLNPMIYDPSLFLNNALATIVGAFLAVVAFRLFMPPDRRRSRRYLVARMRDGLKLLAEQQPIPHYWDWQTRMFDRVNRLYDPANPAAITTDEWYEGGLGTLHLGNEILRLRHLINGGALPERATMLARSILQAFGNILNNCDSTRISVQAANATILEPPPPATESHRLAWRRLQGIAGEIEAFFLKHPRFLNPN